MGWGGRIWGKDTRNGGCGARIWAGIRGFAQGWGSTDSGLGYEDLLGGALKVPPGRPPLGVRGFLQLLDEKVV